MSFKSFKGLVVALATSAAFVVPVTASATFLTDWRFNPDGTGLGGATQVNEFLDFVGLSYVQNYSDAARTSPLPTNSSLGTTFFFNDNGAFRVDTHDFGLSFPQNNFITTLYSGGTGSGMLGGGLTFNAGGTLQFFSDTTDNFASTDGIYGANDGALIGSFTQLAGCQSCFVDPTGLPTGAFAVFFQATSLADGYWFDAAGNPLAAGTVLGFATVNASYVQNPPINAVNEIAGQLAGAGETFTNVPAQDFLVSNNGQYRLAAVPEPGSLALLGVGLLGVALSRRRRSI